jgi:hypothetical protein
VSKTLLPTLAVACLLGISTACPAQELAAPEAGLQTLVTVSFSGYQELFSDIEYVGNLANNPELAKGLEGMLQVFTQGEGLAGVDKTKPWGVVVQTDGTQEFPFFAFVPVTDFSAALGLLEKLDLKAEDTGAGIYEIETPARPLFVKEQSGWAFLGISPDTLAEVPDDPTALLGGLDEKYDLAVRASVKNVPDVFRQKFVDELKLGARAGMERLPGESEEEHALRTGVAKRLLDEFIATVTDLDEVLVGLAIDREAGTSYLDLQVTAMAGTTTATHFAQMAPDSTNFAGFDLPGAALTANWAGTLSENDVAEAKAALAKVREVALADLEDQALSPQELQLATQLLTDLMDVFEKTLENKKSDGGIVVSLDPSAVTLAAGTVVAEGAKLEGLLKQVIGLAQQDEPKLAEMIQLDAEEHEGIRFHKASVPVEELDDPEMARNLFGETFDMVVGIGEDSLYVALGQDAAATLKQVIDKSKAEAGKQVPPLRISIAGAPIVKFLTEMVPDEQKPMIAMVGAPLVQAGGKDHLRLTAEPVPSGARLRLELEEGVLRLIGGLAPLAQALMGAGPGGMPPGVEMPPGGPAPPEEAPPEFDPF